MKVRTPASAARQARVGAIVLVSVSVSAGLLAGCASNGVDEKTDTGDSVTTVTGIPTSWLSDTAEGWPTSDGFGQRYPYLASGECLLGDVPDPFGAGPRTQDMGWGPFGEDASAKDSYMYLCDFWAPDRYAGAITLYQAADAASLDSFVTDFVDRPSIDVQDVSHSEVSPGGVTVEITRTWYPTNPQGKVEALYEDSASNSALVLEVNSLSEEDFGAYTDGDAAADLLGTITAASD